MAQIEVNAVENRSGWAKIEVHEKVGWVKESDILPLSRFNEWQAADEWNSEEPENEYIPDINPADVYLSLEEIGFTTEKDIGSQFGNFWTSTLQKGSIRYQVDISSDEILKVQSIRGVAYGANRNPDEVKEFFKYLTSSLFLYNNNDDSRIRNWIENNFNRSAVTSVGSVKVKIDGSKTIKRIRIDANLSDGM